MATTQFSKIKFDEQFYTAQQIDEILNPKPLFSFCAISDIHLQVDSKINDNSGHDDLIQLFKCLENRICKKGLNLSYICCSGDIGMDGNVKELTTFKNIVSEKCPISPERVFTCLGNHDQRHSSETFAQNALNGSASDKVDENRNIMFKDEEGRCVFAFMSPKLYDDTQVASKVSGGRLAYMTDENREFLESVVQMAKNKTLVLFMHYPLENKKCADTATVEIDVYDWDAHEYVKKSVKSAETAIPYAGLTDRGSSGTSSYHGNGYGFYIPKGEQDYSTKNECEEIIDILNKHEGGKTLVFSGHTHYVFQCEDFDNVVGKGYPNINVCPIPNTDIVTIHIPSLNNPRQFLFSEIGTVNKDRVISDGNPYRQPSQSWIVDVYSDRIVLKGYETNCCHDRKFGDILQQYTYVVDLEDFSSTDEGERS